MTCYPPKHPPVQEAYVRRVIEAVNDLDNVLYEISNENHPGSTDWHHHFIRFIRAEEEQRGRVHPIGMTFQYKGGRNQTLFDSPADWISPNPDGGHRDDLPPADGRKVVLNDTDHLWGIGGSPDWAWKSFLRGHNVLFVDPYEGITFGAGNPAKWEPLRRARGQTRRWAERINLGAMPPQPDLSSNRHCLAKPDGNRPELLIYAPAPGPVRIDLRGSAQPLTATEYDPATGRLASLPASRPGQWYECSPATTGPCLIHLRN